MNNAQFVYELDFTPILAFICLAVAVFGAIAWFVRDPRGLQAFEAWWLDKPMQSPSPKATTQPGKKTAGRFLGHAMFWSNKHGLRYGDVVKVDGSDRVTIDMGGYTVRRRTDRVKIF